MRLATFDIFDTVLIRRCGNPEVVFEQLAERLYPDDRAMCEAFLLWRRQAGSKASTIHHGKDVTLEVIYETIDMDSYREYSIKKMMETEKAVEAENLMANPSVRTLIRSKREDGHQIAFVSDMYLDSAFLKDVLIREECALPEDPVYVSCEHSARKDMGTLYDVVRNELHPSGWEHYGDNLRSDIRMARLKGIKATRVDTAYNPAEKALLKVGKLSKSDNGWQQLIAFSRAARIQHGNTTHDALAADFVAPAYIPYVLFVLQDAQQRGIRRLYFLSRDSYILMRIAKVLEADFPDIEIRYLFVSRRALLLPYLAGGGAEEYLAASDHHTVVRQGSVDERLAQLGTDRKELESNYQVTFPYQRITNKEEEQDFLKKIFDSSFISILQQRAQEKRETFLQYLHQEGVTDGTPSAMVDVGWLGTSRLMLNTILRQTEYPDTFFYYYGIRGDVFPSSAGSFISYYQCGELPTESTALIENYFSASPYPTTIGFAKEGGIITPSFPTGKQYEENDIVKANVEVAEWIAREIHKKKLANIPMLKTWSEQAIGILTQTDTDIDLTPMLSNSDFDKVAFVRRLSFKDIVGMVFLGKHITAFDRASLRLSLPKALWKGTWKMHEITEYVRRKLYLRYINGQ